MKDLASMLVGPLAWLSLFTLVYGLHGLLCGLGLGGAEMFGQPMLRLVLVLAWLAAIGLQAAILAVLYSSSFTVSSAFVGHVSRLTAWVGLVATVWTLAPIAATTPCTPNLPA